MSADANGLHQVKGGEDRVDDIIAQRMRDLNISESSGALKIPEHCVVNSRAHMRKCGPADAAHDAPRISTVAAFSLGCISGVSRRYAPDQTSEFDGSFFRTLPSQADFKKVRT